MAPQDHPWYETPLPPLWVPTRVSGASPRYAERITLQHWSLLFYRTSGYPIIRRETQFFTLFYGPTRHTGSPGKWPSIAPKLRTKPIHQYGQLLDSWQPDCTHIWWYLSPPGRVWPPALIFGPPYGTGLTSSRPSASLITFSGILSASWTLKNDGGGPGPL